MDLNTQISNSEYLQMEDQLTMDEIDRILDFPISTARTRELKKVEDSGINWASGTAEDLYSFIDTFMGSDGYVSNLQSGNQRHKHFVNEQTAVSDVSMLNSLEHLGNTSDSDEIGEQIESAIKEIAHTNLFEDLEQITESSPVGKSLIPTTNDTDASIQNLCFVCSKMALKYVSYGGQVCSSCRSFFYRAVKSKNNSLFTCKKTKICQMDKEAKGCCKYCRFQNCLKSGMKISGILPEEEIIRRYKKFNKTGNKLKEAYSPVSRLSSLYLSFTIEEANGLKEISLRFQVPWLQNFLVFERESAKNLIEYIYGARELTLKSWEIFKHSVGLNFMKDILPRFSEILELSSSDVGQIMKSPASGVAHFFRSCHCIHLSVDNKEQVQFSSLPENIKNMVQNPHILKSFELPSQDCSEVRLPSYEKLFPASWAGDAVAEERHRDAVHKIVNWSKNKDGQHKFDCSLVDLMTLILAFNADFYTLVDREKIERIQTKYIMLLQRYLRSNLSPASANTKFMEAMMLIAQTREAWEISSNYSQNIFQ